MIDTQTVRFNLRKFCQRLRPEMNIEYFYPKSETCHKFLKIAGVSSVEEE